MCVLMPLRAFSVFVAGTGETAHEGRNTVLMPLRAFSVFVDMHPRLGQGVVISLNALTGIQCIRR